MPEHGQNNVPFIFKDRCNNNSSPTLKNCPQEDEAIIMLLHVIAHIIVSLEIRNMIAVYQQKFDILSVYISNIFN